MNNKVIAFNKSQRTKQDANFRAGDVVRVHRKIKEGEKERTQIFEGMIIAIKGGQSSSQTLTVRKVSSGVGVEIIVPLHSPQIEKIELTKRAHVRRSKLYYIRDKATKALRFKFKDFASFAASDPQPEPQSTTKQEGDAVESSDAPAQKENIPSQKTVDEKKEDE